MFQKIMSSWEISISLESNSHTYLYLPATDSLVLLLISKLMYLRNQSDWFVWKVIPQTLRPPEILKV